MNFVRRARRIGIIHRVPTVFVPLSELGPPPPPPQANVAPSQDPSGGDTLACGEGGGGPNFDEGTETLVLYVYFDPSTWPGV
jgi:hypothetical protein